MCFYNSDRNLQTSVNSHETVPLPEKQNSHFLSSFSDAHSQFPSLPHESDSGAVDWYVAAIKECHLTLR